MFSLPKRLFLRLAGIDPDVLARCNSTEQLRYFAIAWTLILILPIEVLISCGHLLWRANASTWILILVSMVALLLSFVGERVAIVTMAGGRMGPAVWMRFLYIIAVAFIATVSFLLHWYERDILVHSLDAQTSFVNAREDRISARLGLPDLMHGEKDARQEQKASVRALTELPESVNSRFDQSNACARELDSVDIDVSRSVAPIRAALDEASAELRQMMLQPDFAINPSYGPLARHQSALRSQISALELPKHRKEHECAVLGKEAVQARKIYLGEAQQMKTAADQHLAEERASLSKARAVFAPISSRVRQVAATVNDGSVNAQIKALGDFLRTDTLARVFAAGVFGLLMLISGFAVWVKLGCRGGDYDKEVLAEEARSDSDRRTEQELYIQTNDRRMQTELDLAQQVDPIVQQQRLASEVVATSVRRHAERMTELNEFLKLMPRHLARNWEAVVSAALAADQAVTIRWLEDYYQATGRPLPADWPCGFSPPPNPAPTAPSKCKAAEPNPPANSELFDA